MHVRKFSSLDEFGTWLHQEKMYLEDLAKTPTSKLSTMIQVETVNCQYCNLPMEESRNGRFCSVDCAQLHNVETMEAEATGN